MKTIPYTFTLIAYLTTNVLFAQGINFQKGSWAEIKAKAKAENKFIFVDAYTTWCGPCKWLSKKVFPQKKVGDLFNKTMYPLSWIWKKERVLRLPKNMR